MTTALIAHVEGHAREHLCFGAVPHHEIAALERRLGRPLPPALAVFLETVGNGIFFGREELLGPARMMIHDIELLPAMMTVKAAAPGLPAAWLPFHRRDGAVHVVDLAPAGFGQVYSWPGGEAQGDIAAFLAERLSR